MVPEWLIQAKTDNGQSNLLSGGVDDGKQNAAHLQIGDDIAHTVAYVQKNVSVFMRVSELVFTRGRLWPPRLQSYY